MPKREACLPAPSAWSLIEAIVTLMRRRGGNSFPADPASGTAPRAGIATIAVPRVGTLRRCRRDPRNTRLCCRTWCNASEVRGTGSSRAISSGSSPSSTRRRGSRLASSGPRRASARRSSAASIWAAKASTCGDEEVDHSTGRHAYYFCVPCEFAWPVLTVGEAT